MMEKYCFVMYESKKKQKIKTSKYTPKQAVEINLRLVIISKDLISGR